jgi:hypothetical protein
MPKQKAKRKFALVEKEILYSKAWTKLTHSERVIYFHLKGEYNGMNSDKLILPYSDMKEIMGGACFWRGIKKLEDVGFIDIVSRGCLPHFKEGRLKSKPNVYKISGRWRMNEKSVEEYAKDKSERIHRGLHREYCTRQEDETSTQNDT